MNRRTFNKMIETFTTGMVVSGIKANIVQNSIPALRLGGPVFKNIKKPESWIECLNNLNYRAAYCPLQPGADTYEIKAFKNAAQNADIVIAEVGAWSNPIDPNENNAKASIEKNIASLRLADEIGANCCVNISGSRNPEKWAGPHKDNLTPETFELIVESTRKIIDAVKPKNTFYTLETMPWAFPDSVDSYIKLINAINRKQFAVHFDPVNLITSPQVYYKNGEMIKNAFKKLGAFIKSCHAKDILLLDNKLTPHMPEVRPGLGNLDYKIFLRELSKLKNIPLMMEHLDSADEYKLAATYIREMGKVQNILF